MKITKTNRNLLIGLLLGDGTISNNNVFKLAHSSKQSEYLQWKISILNNNGIKNNGMHTYTSSCGYNKTKEVVYTQLKITPFIKVLRRVFYKPTKIIGNRKMLNRLSPQEIAIWYMDDGTINYRITKKRNKIHGFYIRISTCVPKQEAQVIVDYFKEVWNIKFYLFHEGSKKDSYSLCCGTQEGIKFINLVSPTVSQVPSMKYKITYDLSQRVRNNFCSASETGDALSVKI